MEHVFLTWTPLHIINGLNTMVNYLDLSQTELIILDDLEYVDDYQKAIQAEFPQLKVSQAPAKSLENEGYLKKTSRLFANSNPFYQDRISQLYIPGDTYFSRLFFSAGKKQNPDLSLNYFEDGLAAYLDMPIIFTKNRSDQLQKALNPYAVHRETFSHGYVYQPSLVNPASFQSLFSLPRLTAENPAFQPIQSIFARIYPNTKAASSSLEKLTAIYLDQPFSHDGIEIKEVDLFNRLAPLMESLDIDLLVKLHPRSQPDKYGQVKLLESKGPWEIFLLLNQDQPLLPMGINSTAIFSPSLMFGDQQLAIVLSKWLINEQPDLYTESSLDLLEKTNRLVERLAEPTTYLPANQEELVNAVQEAKSILEDSNE